MSYRILNVQYILENNRWKEEAQLDHNCSTSARDLGLLRHQLLDLAYYNQFVASDGKRDDSINPLPGQGGE